jgi:hypothetical protein
MIFTPQKSALTKLYTVRQQRKRFLIEEARKIWVPLQVHGCSTPSMLTYIYRSLIYAGRPTREPTEHYVQGNLMRVSVSDNFGP